ncbi:MAG: stage IV sporulation protein A [Clostridia bacterium]|nr:stage IV sporulation protein A [Clostridia bacterium]
MTDTSIYRDITSRTDGDIYIGVVGPVRTGKSTFIKKFMEALVLPNIENENLKQRTIDEMPQSAGGKTVMTTEPKFIPEEAIELTLGDNIQFRVKMVDCVGYVVPDAIGHIEEGKERMVNTLWSKEPMPFTKAAETGTRKVITDHSTIGMVITTDGSITDIPRESYLDAEERVISELKQIHKPFAIIINSAEPESEAATNLARRLEDKYQAPVALVNCMRLDAQDIQSIMAMLLLEFPITEIALDLPGWLMALPDDHWVVSNINASIRDAAALVTKTGDVKPAFDSLTDADFISRVSVEKIDLGKGSACISIDVEGELYYRILSELTDLDIMDEESLITTIIDLSESKKRYTRLQSALQQVEETGYGIVTPCIDDLNFEEPEIIKHPNGYGVKLRANAPSLHIMKANIETEISPVVGTEQQSEDLIKYLLREYEEDPRAIWESNIFGKTMHELVSEGLNSKLENMPEDARTKLCETLERIINEGSGGLICIIL